MMPYAEIGTAMQQQNAALAQAAPVPEQTHASNLAQGCEALNAEMLRLEARLEQMLTRLAGPVPTAGNTSTDAKPQPAGLIGTIESRLMSVAHSIKRSHDLMQRLERIV